MFKIIVIKLSIYVHSFSIMFYYILPDKYTIQLKLALKKERIVN